MCEPVECKRCNGSGEIGISAATGRFMCAGPVPDDATGVARDTCWDCKGMGYVEDHSDER